MKEEFYNQLQDAITGCNRHDMVIVMGDLNVKVGGDNSNKEEVMGAHGIGTINDNGERLCELCSTNGFIITGTIFHHKDVHKATWKSPDGRTVNQIDHVMVNRCMRTSVLDIRVMRGADVYSDHYMVRTKIRLKLRKNRGKKNAIERFDVTKLSRVDIRKQFNVEVKNRFETLLDIEEPEEEHDKLLEVYREAAKTTIGISNKRPKGPHIVHLSTMCQLFDRSARAEIFVYSST